LKRIKRTLIEQQMVELQKIKGQNHFFSTAANQTLHTGMIIQKIHHTNTNEHVRLRTNITKGADL